MASRRGFPWLSLTALLLFSLGAGACSSKYHGKVVVYTPFPEICAQELRKTFERDTGIYVEQVVMGTSRVLSRLRAEKDNPKADVWYGAGGMIPFINATEAGLLEPFHPKGYEDEPYKRGNLILRDQDFHWVGLAIIGLGYAYNPHIMSEDKLPKTWDDLAQPQYKDKIEMWDPASSGTSMLFLEASLLRYIQDGRGEEAGWDYLKAIFKNLRRYTSEGKPAFNVARGESYLGLHFEHQVMEFLEEQSGGEAIGPDRDIRWTLPPDSPVVVDPIALVKGTRNRENAERFINFVLSPEGQKIVNRLFYTVDPHLPPPVNMEGLPLSAIEAKAQQLDPVWMASHMDAIQKRWQNEVEATGEDE